MITYRKLDLQEDCKLIVYGCGKFGQRCIRLLEERGYCNFQVTDINSDRMESTYCGHNIIPIEMFKAGYKEHQIIVAIEKIDEPVELLHNWGFRNVAIYYNGDIYQVNQISLFGEKDVDSVLDKICNMSLCLYSDDDKIRQDIKYIFDWIQFNDILDIGDAENLKCDNTIFLIASKQNNRVCEIMQCYGIEKERWEFLDEFLTILNSRNKIIGKIPSLMAARTIWGKSYNQHICKQPFERMQISSNFAVRSCCGDWAESWGSLSHNTMEEIWNSDVAKIVRCSILNRTYSFCNWMNCVHMKLDAEPTDKRIIPGFKVEEIPSCIEVGIDKTCNLYCKSCRDNVCVETGKKKENNEVITQQIIESGWLDKTKTLLLGGQGEVFVSEVYKRMMYETGVRRNTLDLRSNGILFTKVHLDKLLDKYEKIKVIISIDAARESTYNLLRRSKGKDSWHKLKENLEMLSEARKQGVVSYFQINMCVQMQNYKEIPEFVEMGERLGVDKVYLTPIRNWGTYSPEEFVDVSIYSEGKTLKEDVALVVEKYRANTLIKIEF